ERVALPAPSGIPHVEMKLLADVRPVVEWNHARLVDHLVADRDVAGTLHDVVRIAVNSRQHRAGQAASDTPVVEAEIKVAVETGIGKAAGRASRPRGGARG